MTVGTLTIYIVGRTGVLDFDSYMPVYIPQEIVDIIIGCATANASGLKRSYLRVEDLQNFSNYASVSHTFHQIVLPYEFKSLTFKFHREAGIDMIFPRTYLIPIPKFCEAINAGDTHALSLAPLVQELILLHWYYADMSGYGLAPVHFEKMINGVLSFRNLTKLRMESCVTSPAIME